MRMPDGLLVFVPHTSCRRTFVMPVSQSFASMRMSLSC